MALPEFLSTTTAKAKLPLISDFIPDALYDSFHQPPAL